MSLRLVSVSLAGLLLASLFTSNVAFASPQSPSFLGAWCAQGDSSQHTSITSNGPFISLTNEVGNTATGDLRGSNQIVVPGWMFVTGTLNKNGRRINWSNGTFWTRCQAGGGGWGHHRGGSHSRHRPQLSGTWFANGDHSQVCSISQRQGNLDLRNESGRSATGSFTDKHDITTNWSGITIRGRISHNGNRIDWNNGSYWTRSTRHR
ncbi:MAG: hypothetical protein ACRES9_06665 [Gammaproteobacteria bacterium]